MIGEASAPASAANLGPGFDTLAIALGLRCTATAEVSGSMTITEQGRTKRLDPDDLVALAVDAAVGYPMHITLVNDIPRARGLGSSAAVAASVAAAALKTSGVTADSRSRVFEIVTDLEGHADNAAATVYGGMVAATPSGVQRLDLSDQLSVVVGIPNEPLRTSDARQVLSDDVPREVVVRSLQRLAFLVSGLASGSPLTLAHAAGDELHERPRADLSPVTGEMIEAALGAGAVHASWAGAGPTAIAFVPSERVGRVVGAMSGILAGRGEVMALPVDGDGLS